MVYSKEFGSAMATNLYTHTQRDTENEEMRSTNTHTTHTRRDDPAARQNLRDSVKRGDLSALESFRLRA